MKRPEKYVVLEHLTLPDRGFRFWGHNTEDNTHSAWGDLWYKEVFFTDSEEEAIAECRKLGDVACMRELEEYYNNILYEQEKQSGN
jgi:hypothetical protein